MTKIDFENDRMQSVEQIDSAKRLSDKVLELKDLEDRLQRQKDTREEYGQLNEMGDCWKQIEEFDFAGGDYTTATADEKKEIEGKLESRRDWNKWKKIVHGKETIDLMDEYLDSRTDDNGISRSGNYDYIEKNDLYIRYAKVTK